MPRANARILAEWTLRAVATGLLAVLLFRSLNPPVIARTTAASGEELASLLPRWTQEGPPDSALIRLRYAPDAVTRDWLMALRRSGMSVAWSADSLTPTAVSAEPIMDPAGGVLVRVGTVRGARVALSDDAGMVDSIVSAQPTSAFRVAALSGPPIVTARQQSATTTVPDTVRLRRLLVLGRVGWESKFTIAALEERGWLVDAQLMLSPGQSVQQGPPRALDTARYSAAILLDSASVTNPSVIARYVSDGGGVIVAGTAARVPALSALLPGRAGNRIVSRERLTDTSDTEGVRHAIVNLKSDAIVLEREDSIVTVAARRVSAGRIIQLADEETWRRRMRRAEGSAEAHRDWWTKVVGSVAYAPRAQIRSLSPDAAPLASLVGALGVAADQLPAGDQRPQSNPEPWLVALLAFALLAEWTSRRWRGAP